MARIRFRRPPWWLLVGTVVGAVAIVVLLRQEPTRPLPVRAADVPTAVKALETKLGGAQRYTEINATDKGVNLFVASSTGEQAWYFEDGKLDGPSAPQTNPTTAPTVFTLENVALGRASEIARDAAAKVPDASMLGFTLRHEGQQGLVWAVDFRSSLGGLLHVTYGPAGGFIGVDAQ